ncbi:hypothetical protein [Pseudomonas sp. RC10]|uniref:hypothetical protein n=1 Tax=Pseudomonas bambusae TaxID=3139142 RepID=UPI00313893CF
MSSTASNKSNFLGYALAGAVIRKKPNAPISQNVRQAREAEVVALVAPLPPDWWAGDPSFAGLVPKDDQEKDMPITIAEWPEFAEGGDSDRLQFQWKPAASSDWQDAQDPIDVPGAGHPGDFPIELNLSSSNFADEGRFELRYYVDLWNGTRTLSDTTTFIIDKTPPNANQSPSALTFSDASIVSNGITAEYLAANGGVDVTIAPYRDKQLGDSLELYVHNENTVPTDPVFVSGLDASQTVKVPTNAFDGLRDGMIYMYYRLVDKVGNRGAVSDNAETGLFIKPLPVVPLAAPLVPRIDNDKVLNLDDVLLGENLVEIPLYGNWLEGDQLILTWGTSPVQVVHEMTSAQDPIVLNVSYTVILAPAYGTGPGKVATPISYVVKRGNRTFGSAVTPIDVDFFVPGPVNPDRPKPVNPSLAQVTARGTGPNPRDNVLGADDANLPVDVSFDLYSPIGTGEQIILYWYSLDHPVGTFSPVSGTPGDVYTFSVAWDDIKDLPSSSEVPVFYTVGLADGTGNIEMCIPTLVDVTAALPIILAEPQFPDAVTLPNGELILNCDSFVGPDQAVNVNVPGNAPLLAGGETLTFSWQPYTDRLGATPAGSPIEHDKTITADEAANGFAEVFTPFSTHIEPAGRNGSVKLTYTSDTVPPMEGSLLIRVSSVNAGGTCPPNFTRSASPVLGDI